MLKAVVFDMDGLLVDTNPVWAGAREWMAAEAGRAWDDVDNQAVMGVATQEWVDYMIDRLGVTLSPDEVEAAIVGRMLETYEDHPLAARCRGRSRSCSSRAPCRPGLGITTVAHRGRRHGCGHRGQVRRGRLGR